MQSLDQFLRESIEDFVLSRKERRDFRESVTALDLDERERVALMSRIRDLAIEYVNDENYPAVLTWSYEAYKTVAQLKTKAPSHSVYFSPGDECKNAIVHLLSSAQNRVLICVFTISDNDISDEILHCLRRGLAVKLISDNYKAFDKGSDLFELQNKGVEVRFDKGSAHMHHKFAIIDDALLTGSYNWTRSAAERNYENIVVSNTAGLLKEFQSEFDRLWDKFK
ncbi:MAG: phospholipase D-like domain-containing protein [Flavobacteriales bacterium]|nr:phospholipase D-like domain-containing protein [Flavobacteriales bacterium]